MPIKPETKHILAASLEALMEKKRFEDISVQDIINHCGASRTTLYRHFKDKYELMNWIYKNRVDQFIEMNTDIASWRDMLLQITKFIKEKQRYFTEIVDFSGQNSFVEFLLDYGQNYCTKELRKELGDDIPEEVLFSVKQYCAGTTYLTYDWIRHGLDRSPEHITKLMCENMPNPISKYFR